MTEPFMRSLRWLRVTALTALACTGLTNTCAADPSSVSSVLQDTRLYLTAPLRWDQRDWLQFGGSLAAIAVAHEYDADIRADNVRSGAMDNDPHSLRDAAPAAVMLAGTWAAATLFDSRGGREEGKFMLEATALTMLSTTVFKMALGRQRPNETAQVDAWREGGDSFPSMHVSVAFAVGTVLAESGSDDYRWLRRTLGYGLAAATAYARVDGNAHWTSDAVAGAALGIATAQFTLNHGHDHARPDELAFALLPVERGVMLSWTLPLE
jgi:hypothetical protein